jgi:hypothetical protein
VRRESKQEREAWTAFIDGGEAKKENKYGAERSGKYASKHEADVAGKLSALERMGAISELREQVSFTLVEGLGRIKPIRYIADFTFLENGKLIVADAKGFSKNQVYRLKKKMMALILGYEIREL